MSNTTHNVTIRLETAMRERIRSLAESRQKTPHWVLREALREAALTSWQDYEETGLHATGEEIIAWVESWGTKNALDAPEISSLHLDSRLRGNDGG